MTDEAQPPGRRRKTPATARSTTEMRAAVQRLVQAMETLGKTLAELGPRTAALERRIDAIEGWRNTEEGVGRIVQQSLSVMAATVARLDAIATQEEHRGRVWRTRMRVVLRSVAGGCGTLALALVLSYLTGSGGRLSTVPWPLIVSAILLLLGLATICLAASTPVPELRPEQINPVTTVQP